jgi:flagellar biosynthesis GTPase FlhF
MDLDLITIEPQNALSIYTTEGAIAPFLAKVRNEIDAFEADVSTNKGRKEIASFAAKISKVKVYLDDGVGKRLADEQKLIPKKIDACRKHIRDTLEGWRDEVRQPLTDWEDAERARVARHTGAIARLEHLANMGALSMLSTELRSALDEVQAVEVGPACEEYEAAYAKAKDAAVTALTAGIMARERYEAEQAELAALRAAAEERAKKDREEQIAREAADRARREAEEKAAADALRAQEAIQREREAAERREWDLKRQAEDAERRAAEAVEAERRKLEQQKAAEEAEARRRKANMEHRLRINREALHALVNGGIAEDAAKATLKLIITGQVPHVTIEY